MRRIRSASCVAARGRRSCRRRSGSTHRPRSRRQNRHLHLPIRRFPSWFIREKIAYRTLPKSSVKLSHKYLTHSVWRVVGVATDITEQRHLEEQLRRAQRMESIGRLAGGIAHVFNNLITVITGSAELAREALPSNHPGRADLQVITASAERATALTRQLLAFARKQMLEPRVITLTDLLAEMDKLLRRLVPADIELVT